MSDSACEVFESQMFGTVFVCVRGSVVSGVYHMMLSLFPVGYKVKVGGSNPVNDELFNIHSTSGLYEIMRDEIV